MSPSGSERVSLEAQRDFLLRSLADLEAERQRGDLTDDRFDRLSDGYTARAAAVLRALERSAPTGAEVPAASRRRRTGWRRAGVAGALAAAVAAAAAVLPGALGDRGSGQTITGNAQSVAEPTAAALARAVDQRPDDAQARLAYAGFLLDDGELVEAVRQFDAVTRLDPTNAEALAYSGWIIALAGLTDPGLERLDAALAADPAYPGAHLLRGMARLEAGDGRGAATDLERYLDLAPDGPQRAQAEALLVQARRAASTGP